MVGSSVGSSASGRSSLAHRDSPHPAQGTRGAIRPLGLTALLGAALLPFCLGACGAEGSSAQGSTPGGGNTETGGATGTATGGTSGTGAATGTGAAAGTGGDDGGSATGGQNNGGPMDPPSPNDNDRTPAPDRPGFTLLFEDHFDTLDTSRWQTASHTFDENAAQFDPSMVAVEDGFLRLGLDKTASPSAEGREYLGGELRTHDFFGYGRFEARIRFAPGSGVVSSLFTFYDHYADPDLPENWNEIDIEFLGKNTSQLQFNVIHWNASNQKTTHERLATTGFDPSAEFHDYAVEWLPNAVNFYIDDELVHSQTDQIADFLKLDSRLMMNVWPVQNTPDLTAWAGTFTPDSVPTAAYYDWVRVYAYDP